MSLSRPDSVSFVGAAVIAAVVAAVAVYLVARPIAAGARRLGVVDVPGGRKAHDAATPLLGGAALFGGLTVAVCCAATIAGRGFDGIAPLLVAGVAAWGIGTVDDWRGVKAGAKALLQACVAVAWFRMTGVDGPTFWMGVGFVFFTMNGMNLLDNTDGLCSVAALPPFVGLAALSFCGSATLPTTVTAPVVPLAIIGALAGFLPHNLPRARIFLGDGGSLVVGFLLGALVYQFTVVAHGLEALPAACCFVALPLLDTTTVVVARLRAGRPVWVGDRNHLSHRLHARGWSERRALVGLGVLAALGAALGVWMVLA